MVNGGIQDLIDRISHIAIDRTGDLGLQIIEQVLAVSQDGGDGGHDQHGKREDGEHRIIGDAGGKLVAAFGTVALVHAHEVVNESGLGANLIYRTGIVGIGAFDAVVVRLLRGGLRGGRHVLPFLLAQFLSHLE